MRRSPGLPTAARASRRGRSFFACRASWSTGTSSPPTRCARGAAALVCERPLGHGVPEVVVPSVRAAMGPLAAAFHGRPTRAAAGGRRDRHERQDDDRLPGTPRARGGRHPDRAARARSTRWSAAGSRRSSARRPRRSTCRRTFARMLDGGRPGLRDGGVLARARAAPRGRHRVRLRGVHEPDAGPPRLPRHARRLLRRQAKLFLPANGERADGGRRQRRRRMGPQARGRARRSRPRRARSRSRSTATPTTAPAACATTRPGSSFECATAAGAVEVRVPLPGPVQRLQRARGDRRGAARWACRWTRPRPRSSLRAACRAASSRSTRARGSGCWWTTRTRRTRSRTCWSSARELLDQAGGEGRLIVRLRRRAATATARSAP